MESSAAAPDSKHQAVDLPAVAELRRAVKVFGGRRAVDDVSFALQSGDRLAVIGESGSGKSTIARLVLGLHRCDIGSAHVFGTDWGGLSSKASRALRKRIGVVFQEPVEALDPRLRVRQIIAEPLAIHHQAATEEEVHKLVLGAMAKVQLDETYATRKPHQLSGGQAQRVALARAIVNNPELLVLDEPTSALDVSVQAQVLDLLSGLATGGSLSWIFITHDLGVAAEICDQAIVVFQGSVVESGPIEQVLTHPTHSYTRNLVAASLHGRIAMSS